MGEYMIDYTTTSGTVQYYGRGYLQLTWKENYEAAKAWGCNTYDIVNDPDKVVTDEDTAWCATAWFWYTNVNKDRCDKARDGKRECEMGNTIDAINGKQECTTTCGAEPKNRFCYYKKFYEKFPARLWVVGMRIQHVALALMEIAKFAKNAFR